MSLLSRERSGRAGTRSCPDPIIQEAEPANAIDWYDRHAGDVAAGYERLDARRLYAWIRDRMPMAPATALDIGAGTGRDAAWLADQGYRTTAVEPSRAMRMIAIERRPNTPVRWIDDRLPQLETVRATGIRADLVLINAVWMHLPRRDRARAFEAIAGATAPGGLIVMSLRHGQAPPERCMHKVDGGEIERLAEAAGGLIERTTRADDQRTRPDLNWTLIAIRL